jgi:hypothetical protein
MSGGNDNITAAFLRHVLPDEGYYACFIQGTKRHLWFNRTDELSDAILRADAASHTVYHGCASFVDATRRTQERAKGARAFWLDIDLAPKSKYANVQSAAEGVAVFCQQTRLPVPVYVGSGRGLHIYWPLEQTLVAQEWRQYAGALKRLCHQFALDAGPERTSDIASILRTPGTHNRKNGLIVPVQCGPLVGPYPIEAFGRLLDERTDDGRASRRESRRDAPRLAGALGNVFDDEPRSAALVADQCGQLGAMRKHRGRLPEPLWYAALGVCTFCTDGSERGHEWSSGFAGYTHEETEERLARARRLSGATTCEKFHSLDPKTCEACPHWGKIKSPISLGRPHSQGPRAQTEGQNFQGVFGNATRDQVQEVDDLPPLPHDFFWSPQRALISKSENAKGGGVDIVVSNYPIYLDSVQTGEVRGEWTFILKQFIPERGWFDISIAARVLFGSQSAADLASAGANIHEHSHFVRYVRAAIDMHYRSGKLTTRYDQFGWKGGDNSFLYGLDLYSAGGAAKVVGNDEIQTRCREDWVGPCTGGDLGEWKRAINSLFALGCEPQSVALLASFAAPLMRFQERDEGGAIIHLVTRESGTGKSTALIGAASVWGRREGLGLTNDDTKVSKALTLGALGNLPVIYDEMTIRDPEAIRNFVINFTNGRDKMRATRSGEIKHTASTWQTIMISAANSSLVDVLSGTGMAEAPAYRILEFQLEVPDHQRAHQQGDKLRKALRNNSGHAGAVFLDWLVKPDNLAWTKAALERMTQQTWERTGLKSEHRFWVRTIAAIAVAGVIVKKLDLVEFSVERIMTWLFGYVGERKTTTSSWPVDALAEFLNANRDSTLVVERAYIPGERQRPSLEPRFRLAIRYEKSSGRYLIAQTALREWLIDKEQSYQEMVRSLEASGVVTRRRCQATLGAGTDIPGGQVWCVEVDGAHKDLGGIAPIVADNVVSLAKKFQ